MSRSKEKTEKSHNEKPPKWLKSLLDHQTESLKSVINDALNTSNKSPNPSPKRRKVHSNTSKSKSSKPKKSHDDDEDDFDQRFGHLIGPDVNNDKDDNNNDKYDDDDDEGEIEEFSDSQIDEDHSESEHSMVEEEND